MTKTYVVIAAAVAVSAAIGAPLPEREEADVWGGRREHPAVVNPVAGNAGGRILSLRGEWDFTVMGCGSRNGLGKRLYAEKDWPGTCKLLVPGGWEAQGIGRPGMSECWDIKGDNNAKPIRHFHVGYACYRKTVRIPASWADCRIWLKVGGVKSCGWFWVNGGQVAMVENYCGTCKYEITDLVTPGTDATVVAQVTSGRPSRKGLMSAMHKWGGLYRDVEIEATPQAFIDDAWVRGDFDRREAEVHVELDGVSGEGFSVRATIEGETAERPVPSDSSAGDIAVRVPLASFRPWSPDHPDLYIARIELLKDGAVVHERRERFGVRKFEARGKEFYLNGKPFYLRGFGDDHVYPLTGISPADRKTHLAHLLKAREAGFNFVRLHTHCEVPEYFEAADEAGIMVQAELPYYGDNTAESMEFDPMRDVTELWRNFRRHPSFAVYCNGNEGSFGPVLDRRLYEYVKKLDPDRLKIGQDNHEPWGNPPEAADFLQTHAKPWARGRVEHDRPFVAHEYLNLSVKCDSRDEAKFTGIWMPPATRKDRAAWLEQFGLDMQWGDRLQDAQHALQAHYQKQGIEHIRSDPNCDGYWFWTIADVVVENRKSPGVYTAQGLFNPFWEQKRGGASASDFAQFNGPSCLIADVPDTNRVFFSGAAIDVDFHFANYGDGPVRNSVLEWRLGPGAGGRLPLGEIAVGPAVKIGSAKLVFPDVAEPCKIRLSANVGSVANSWDFWVFPRRERHSVRGVAVADAFREVMEKRYRGLLSQKEASKAQIVIAEWGSPLASEALARGQRVITIANADAKPNVSLGWWWLGSQTGVAVAEHPALSSIPHEGFMSPLFFRLVRHGGLPLPCRGLLPEDVLMVGESSTNCVLHLGQANAGGGKILMSFGLNLTGDTPEAVALMDGLIRYASSGQFSPKSRIQAGEAGAECDENPYGACAHVTVNEPAARTCAAMRGAGLSWVRSDIDWRKIEREPGVWDFSGYDRVVAECEGEGMQLLPILYRPPTWAQPVWEHLDEWAEFVRRFVEHYGRRLPVIEIWNEQNASGFWGDRPNATNYLAVLRRAREAAKGADPSVRVAFGGVAGVPLDFIEEIYRLGGADAFDIMNVHPYTEPYRPEGEIDADIESLRALMAKYGDADKPLWVTEVGWSTHKIFPSDADILLSGLEAARPWLKSWRALYVPAQTDRDDVVDNAMLRALEEILPQGSTVELCRAPDVAARLAAGDIDAVVHPFSEDYAADAVDVVFDFVKGGGVLVDFGGMPMYNAYVTEPDGTTRLADEPHPERDRHRFRIAEAAWWLDERYPKSVSVHPTAAASGVTPPPGGFKSGRFFTDALLEPGDEFIPLLSARTNGIDAVAAAVYKFGGDMKGAVVVSGIINRGCRGTIDEGRQAVMCARALGICFAEGVDRLFWYEFRQGEKDPLSPNSFFGLVHDDFSPKPALGALRAFIDARPAGSVQKGGAWRSTDGKTYFPQWKRPDGRDAGMIWKVDGVEKREVEFSSPEVEFADAAGAKVRPPRKGRAYTLEITDSPLYFIGGEMHDK